MKKVASILLERLNALLVLDWRKRSGARAKVRIEIEDTLENLPQAYSDELFRTKCNVLFEHVYEAYMGDGASVYSGAASLL